MLNNLIAKIKASKNRLYKKLIINKSKQLYIAINSFLEDLAVLKINVKFIKKNFVFSIESVNINLQKIKYKIDGFDKEIEFEIKDLKNTINNFITKIDIVNN